jgi:predicted secreted protein
MSRFLVYLPVLACPLLMLVCMAGMRRMGGTPAQTKEPAPATTADRIARLEEELAALRAEEQDTPADTAQLSSAPAPARSHADPRSAQRVS